MTRLPEGTTRTHESGDFSQWRGAVRGNGADGTERSSRDRCTRSAKCSDAVDVVNGAD